MSDKQIVFREPEQPAVAPRKVATFKIKTYTMDDKYEAMRYIHANDPQAEFKVTGDWSFKVRTSLTHNELMVIMMTTKSFNRLRAAWFF